MTSVNPNIDTWDYIAVMKQDLMQLSEYRKLPPAAASIHDSSHKLQLYL